MESVGTPLKEWDISIYFGVKTGCNEAFIIDEATRQSLIAEDPKSVDLLKPVLRGRDIRRYQAQWDGLWLIDTHNGYSEVPPIDAREYPAIKRHLDYFYPKLEKRQDKGVTPYNLRNCAYHAEFEKEKLFWMDMAGKEGRVSYCRGPMFCLDKGFMLTGEKIKYLTAILNSSLVSWYVNKVAPTTGAGLAEWKKFVIGSVPIPKPNATEEKSISLLAEELASKSSTGEIDVKKLNVRVDMLVNALYELSEEEKKILNYGDID